MRGEGEAEMISAKVLSVKAGAPSIRGDLEPARWKCAILFTDQANGSAECEVYDVASFAVADGVPEAVLIDADGWPHGLLSLRHQYYDATGEPAFALFGRSDAELKERLAKWRADEPWCEKLTFAGPPR